ncbi:MAG: GntR family transcriptional regulator [Clostridiales bacterium]|jgi:GntR family transcriptional repressor for pyruvate dehydrogenase complex|nr:GntR family transcriptional regulator [Clostridiales bacterium]
MAELAFRPLKQKSKLSQQVLENIKNALMAGDLHPGDKLPSLTELASQMNVGISSVREAVKMLEALDVLVSRQGEGTFVSGGLSEGAFNAQSLQLILMPRSVKDLVEFRRMYETAYTRLAVQNATEEDLAELDEIVSAQEAKSKTEELGEQDEWDFHFCVLQSTHSPYIVRMGESMLELFLSTMPVSAEVASSRSIAEDHRNLARYIREKNAEGIDKILKKSFDGWEQRLEGLPFVEKFEDKDASRKIDHID